MFLLCVVSTLCVTFHVCIGGLLDITLGEVLSFFTGTNRIPPLGFADATLNFSPTNPYPTASTCALTLTLPTKYASYADFKVLSMQSHGGFSSVTGFCNLTLFPAAYCIYIHYYICYVGICKQLDGCVSSDILYSQQRQQQASIDRFRGCPRDWMGQLFAEAACNLKQSVDY